MHVCAEYSSSLLEEAREPRAVSKGQASVQGHKEVSVNTHRGDFTQVGEEKVANHSSPAAAQPCVECFDWSKNRLSVGVLFCFNKKPGI